ncbi:hypothetical protein HMI56_001678 [Coelomomyces lativittatus]|nr:hypothetical protein HMI56_001678 [Coelomomyces lativittatus]
MMPVISDFRLSKAFAKDSKSIKTQGTYKYYSSEQFSSVGTFSIPKSSFVYFSSYVLLYITLYLSFSSFKKYFYIFHLKTSDHHLSLKFVLHSQPPKALHPCPLQWV